IVAIGTAIAGPAAAATCDSARWLDPAEGFCVLLPSDAPRSGLRVFLGHTDVSLWFRVSEDGRLSYQAGSIALAHGEQELVVRAQQNGAWAEIERRIVRILAPGGYQRRLGRHAANLTVESQRGFGTPGSAARPRTLDVGGQAALGFELARAGSLWRFDSSLVGSSHRDAGLRYSQLGERAPRIDLSEYQLSFTRDGTEAYAGHLVAGRHPLLLQDFDARGLLWRQKLGSAGDLAVGRLNGSTIVGYDNLSGLGDTGHRIDTMTAGVELLRARPGALRVELSWLDGAVRAIDDFNAGEISDAERSRGVGARIQSSLFDNRLRTDAAWASSRYVNPQDPLLAQGSELVPVRAQSQQAQFYDLQWEVLRPGAEGDAAWPEVHLHARLDRAEPLYRSVGSGLRADSELVQVSVDSNWDVLSLGIAAQRHVDNLDRIPTILRTGTRTRTLTGGLNLPVLFGKSAPAASWPVVTVRHLQQQQRARNAPESFQPSHLPDQRNRELALGLRWSWRTGNGRSSSSTSSRTTAREDASARITAT
ncbi:MAG: hypothetical protein HC872_08275, partial [Gammaproteobacteria bacterium]|nr:hypothetical protein [Gammaproteobacteria bacterium]